MIDWHGALIRRKHLDDCIETEERAQSWGRAALFREERDRLPHPGWLRIKPWTSHDTDRLRAARPDLFARSKPFKLWSPTL